jgi:hypothetical protein
MHQRLLSAQLGLTRQLTETKAINARLRNSQLLPGPTLV